MDTPKTGSGRDTKLLLVAVHVFQTLVAPKVSDTDSIGNLRKGTVSFFLFTSSYWANMYEWASEQRVWWGKQYKLLKWLKCIMSVITYNVFQPWKEVNKSVWKQYAM